MAISDELPGLQVTIQCGGNALEEYEDTDTAEDERTVTRYVEAISGRSFAVQMEWTMETPFAGDRLACKIVIDGHDVQSPLLQKDPPRKASRKISVNKRKLPGGMVQSLEFTSLETASDGKALIGEALKVKDLGTITVTVGHKWAGKLSTRSSTRSSTDACTPMSIVSEKAIKGRALSHGVKFGTAVKGGKERAWKTRLVTGVPNPAVTFVFYYRSLEALKSMLIIPRTPTPPPIERKDASTLTQDEIRDMQRRLLELEHNQVKIKREKNDDNTRPRKLARPSAVATQFEIDDEGAVRESMTPNFGAKEAEIIELD